MANEREPRTYPTGNGLTVPMPNPNGNPTVITPLPTLRDAASVRPDSVHDLPLWRPDVSPTAARNTEPSPAEQTEIGIVAAQVVGHTIKHEYMRKFNRLRAELRAEPRKVMDDLRDIVTASVMDAHAILAELESVAESMGFRSASVRRLGKGLAHGDMSAADVLEELHALG